MLSTISRKFAFTDNLEFLHSFERRRTWTDLSRNMTIPLASLWLKLSEAETVIATSYLNNQEAKGDLKVYESDKLLSFCAVSTDIPSPMTRKLIKATLDRNDT